MRPLPASAGGVSTEGARSAGAAAIVSVNGCPGVPSASSAVTVTVRPSARAVAATLSSPVSGSMATPSPVTLNFSTEPWKKDDTFKTCAPESGL